MIGGRRDEGFSKNYFVLERSQEGEKSRERTIVLTSDAKEKANLESRDLDAYNKLSNLNWKQEGEREERDGKRREKGQFDASRCRRVDRRQARNSLT